MKLSYTKRIAWRLTSVTALIVLIVFGLIYFVVNWTVVQNIDNELRQESDEHSAQIFLADDKIRFSHKNEWAEREHQEIQFNPIFVEIVSLVGESMDRSPNLKDNHLLFHSEGNFRGGGLNLRLGDQEVRQMQIPLNNKGKLEGYLLVATSFEDARRLLTNLRNILFFLYPLILFSLYFTMKYLAAKSIQPIKEIIGKANQITQNNLNERIPQPVVRDEIGQLALSINSLLARLEQAISREKQFTSDASHELRTPLAVLKGTLEVTIRKPRTEEEYVSKIRTGLQSIDKMTIMLDQLLALARAEKVASTNQEEIELTSFVEEIKNQLGYKGNQRLIIENLTGQDVFVHSSEKSLEMVITNLIQNALKYSDAFQSITIAIGMDNSAPFITVSDKGQGIEAANIDKVFDPFFREKSMVEQAIPGTGLGLAIVRKLCQELKIEIQVQSIKDHGTVFKLIF
ncbi:ATP-binding protein [Rhodonellum sp.]|uniref:sensor histidine kinase n=1 Tax=Rhodonellum sp. TaxID=2231180 RepID=UPI002725C4ED|nr:ATP-binding protein [Rhodonellum sp.]MDO9553417.1 ATP-binding protein [Rhodonellum sp.]